MQISLKARAIGYHSPAKGVFNLMFFEGDGGLMSLLEHPLGGISLEVQVDQSQAQHLVRELTQFLQRSGHPLFQDLEQPMRSITGVRSADPISE